MKFTRRIAPLLALMSSVLFVSGCAKRPVHAHANWTTNFAAAQARAKAQNKLVLLNFMGSDWCGWCNRMDEETFDTKPFKDYADANLELVELDFPEHNYLPDFVVQQNNALRSRFEVDGFPTFVVLGPNGSTLATLEGYQPGGPEAFIAKLKKLAPPVKS
jgi:thioredoxin-related protein